MTPTPPSRGPGGPIDFDAVVDVLWRQRWTFFGFLGAVVLATLVGSLVATKRYQAVSVIQLLPRAGQEMDVNEVRKSDEGGYMEGRDRARTQIQIILSRSVREEVARRYMALGHDDIDTSPDGLGRLERALSAGPREDTQLVEIRVLHPIPDRAAELANLVAQVYFEASLEQRRDVARDTRVWLEGQSDTYRAELAKATEASMAFKAANDLVDVDEKVNAITSRLASLQGAAGATTTERVLLSSRVSEYERLLKNNEIAVLASMFDDPSLAAMTREKAAIVTRSAEVLARYGERHPEHQRVVEHIRRVDDLIAAEVRRNLEAERSRLATLRRQERQIEEEMQQVKTELLAQQRLLDEYSRYRNDEDRARRLVESLGEREVEVDLQARTRLSDVRIVEAAVVPVRPAKPDVPLNLAIGLLVGVTGGLGLSLLRHRLDDVVLGPNDLVRQTDADLLGMVPSLPAGLSLPQRALYPVAHPRSLSAEAMRALRAMLHGFVNPNEARCLLVTSSVAGEGKSNTAVGLAIAFARLGARTLIIDGDLRRPSLHLIFGQEQGPGLAECLGRPIDPLDLARRTEISQLDLLPAGAAVPNPNELLSGQTLPKMLARLGTTYHVVIVDSSPAGLVSDAMSLARHCTGVLMVVRRGEVSGKMVQQTVTRLRQAEGKVLGLALNDVPPRRAVPHHASSYYGEEPPAAEQPAAR